jgi:uncharacterized protein YbaP (TraB family)
MNRKTGVNPMIRTALAAAFLFLPTIAFAQACGTRDLVAELDAADRARLDALVAPHAYAAGNLFRATKGESEVTIVGTLHLPDPRHAATLEKVRPAIEAADLLILEASSETQTELQGLAGTRPELFFITEGPTLIDLLTEEEWARLTDELAKYGIPGFMAAKFQPWFLGMTLSVPPCALQAIQTGEKGLDYMVEAVALEKGVPVAELDDLDALMELLAGAPIDEQLDGLRMWLDMQTDGEAEITTMIEGYFDGRTREVWEFTRLLLEDHGVANGEAMFEELNQSLLIGRNRDWEPKVAEFVEGKDAVIAVGAAHLSGESGVLRALERAGYEVEAF